MFFTSDHHFGHRNIIGYCDRPFSSVEEMDEILIQNWNKVVPAHEIVNVIGDFSFYDFEKTKAICDRLHGRKILVKGNHDRHSNQWFFRVGFESVLDKFGLQSPLGSIEVCHYPTYEEWPLTPILFHGHAHNNFKAKHYATHPRVLLNFAVENWSYTPVPYEVALDTVQKVRSAFQTEGTTLFKVGEI